jgi:hypothetical protein
MNLHSTSILVFLLATASFCVQWCDAHDAIRKGKKKKAERAITMWWVLFNKPSECTANPSGDVKCGIKDVMRVGGGGENKAEIVIMHASGGISDKYGCLRMTSALYKTCTNNLVLEGNLTEGGEEHYTWGGPASIYNSTTGSMGYCPAADEDTEVHIVLRDHGPVTDDELWQLTRFTDPSCSQNGGPNLCVDNGAVGFPSINGDGMMTADIGHFPMFPPGCAASGDCDADVEEIQLKADMDNKVTLIKAGDVLQVVTQITVPKV